MVVKSSQPILGWYQRVENIVMLNCTRSEYLKIFSKRNNPKNSWYISKKIMLCDKIITYPVCIEFYALNYILFMFKLKQKVKNTHLRKNITAYHSSSVKRKFNCSSFYRSIRQLLSEIKKVLSFTKVNVKSISQLCLTQVCIRPITLYAFKHCNSEYSIQYDI